jgi:hypothetical protein
MILFFVLRPAECGGIADDYIKIHFAMATVFVSASACAQWAGGIWQNDGVLL